MSEKSPAATAESLTDIEAAAINRLLSRYHESIAASDLTVEKREFTGGGCYVHFKAHSQRKHLVQRTGFLAGIGLNCDELNNGIGFMLFVHDGMVTFLECYTYAGENWPSSFSNPRFVEIADASEPPTRDLL